MERKPWCGVCADYAVFLIVPREGIGLFYNAGAGYRTFQPAPDILITAQDADRGEVREKLFSEHSCPLPAFPEGENSTKQQEECQGSQFFHIDTVVNPSWAPP